MKAIERKQQLLQRCFDELEERVDSLKKVMDDAQQSANDYGQPKDRYDSYRTQLLRKRDMFGQQLQKLLEQKKILEKVDPGKSCDTVEFGALVTTNTQVLYITIGLGKVECNGKEYFVVSPVVPFYKAMEGKKSGEEFEFRGKKFIIREIL